MTAKQYQTLIDEVRTYHRETKHSLSGYAPGPGYLDWESQPNPFRRYANARTVSLPICTEQASPAFSQLTTDEIPAQPFDVVHLSKFLELSMGLSAWKQFGGESCALRQNPSSGNLHPTELYLVLWQPLSEALTPGIYHYAPHEHALECRKAFDEPTAASIVQAAPQSIGAIALTSIHWREAWKYGARALRYCQHDVGHALGAIRYAAATLGWNLQLDVERSDAEIKNILGLGDLPPHVEREYPDLLLILGNSTPDAPHRQQIWRLVAECPTAFTGTANRLSPEHVPWPQIDSVLPALEKTVASAITHKEAARSTSLDDATEISYAQPFTAEAVIRKRRSAQRMKAGVTIQRDQFVQILARTMPSPSRKPFDIFPFQPAIHLLLFVHTVKDMAPGLYALLRTHVHAEAFMNDCRNTDFTWRPVSNCSLPLYELTVDVDVRRLAAEISCGQSIAGNSAFSLGMIADMGGTLGREGPWSYRRLFWEAGLIGQVLYLDAEAHGQSGTGIGCFFDDSVHQLLGLSSEGRWQSIYHFTIGTALPDQRLTTLPGYYHLHRQGVSE